LSDEIRTANDIKSKHRLDCIQYSGNYTGLLSFVNSKGQLFFYLTPARGFISSDSKRVADWSLTNNSQNLSSIYIEDLDYPNLGFGYCNANPLLLNGQPNPMFEYRFDGYLFQVCPDYSVIELLVIPGGRNLIRLHYKKLIDGGYDAEIRTLRDEVRQFYSYSGL
jgi:hypothetical protein